MDTNTLVNQAAAAAEYEDQTIDTGGQFDNEPHPAGKTPARFIGYVECGKRPQKPYQGKPRPDCEEVRVYFELNGKKHQREIEVDGVKKTVTNVISVKVAKKTGDKATFAKLLKKMAYGRDIKHIAQMLGEGFLIDVVHNTVAADGDKPARTYANMRDDEGVWLIGAPNYEDPMTGDSHVVPVPEVAQPMKLLLWASPTREQWDSIFIDGSRTVKDEKGQEKQVSKNWLQEDIVTGAVNYANSPLEAMLSGLGDLTITPDAPNEPQTPADGPSSEPAPVAPETPAAPATEPEKPVQEAPAQTKQDTAGEPGQTPEDVMASLGL